MKDNFRNENGAYFERDIKSEESYLHFCDHIQKKYMPEIRRHDIHTYLYIDGSTKGLSITYCPLCGKCLD